MDSHGKLKKNSDQACADFNAHASVHLDNHLTVEQFMSRVKAQMEVYEAKIMNPRVNLSAEDPELSPYDEMVIALVNQSQANKAEKANESEAKSKKRAVLADISFDHGYGDHGMFVLESKRGVSSIQTKGR